ncbi:MAG TPA: hypothetical protein VGO93_25955 [Candidatus Xenobia bacterium]
MNLADSRSAVAAARGRLGEVQRAARNWTKEEAAVRRLEAHVGDFRGPQETSDTLTPHFAQELEQAAHRLDIVAITPGGAPASPLAGVPEGVPARTFSVTLRGSSAALSGLLHTLDASRYSRLVKVRRLSWSQGGDIALDLDVYGHF